MKQISKLFVITHRDLSPGQQAVQASQNSLNIYYIKYSKAVNHLKVYNLIIQKAQSENRIKYSHYLRKKTNTLPYYESHHIFPKCLGGTNDAENMVLLTAREHYVCHKLLTYIYKGHRGIALAFFRMTYDKQKRKVTSYDYEYAKLLNNNTPISEETSKKHSAANRRRIISQQTRQKLSKAGTGRKHTEQTKQKLRDSKLGEKNPMFGKISPNRGKHYSFTEEQRKNLSESMKGKSPGVNLIKKECEYCHRIFTWPSYCHYHGDKCKEKNKQMKQTYKKLYVITRSDLRPVVQMLQGCHAAIEFQHEHPEIAKEWNINSKYLIFLSVENEIELQKLLRKIQFKELKYSMFFEPDIGNQLTAIALEPGQTSEKLVSNLPLMLKELDDNFRSKTQ